ncbi:NO-inducible flavohemoprotein [Thermoactinomyces vulgaris]|uniref:NO-inducible flavohemoprotein n=1 Tax=Thermoactinomyces vulgaris TaxID=2026 RepID=UPI001F250191|nr:NO-inducible flavohemoprotein [Thermoactinomyces vulgaris]MCF6134573.1 NO-inducible flavohemoprotein [Thermoactinomyces vulgaris]
MLDAKTMEIIKTTAPVLKENNVAIGKRFYELLFTRHPELLHIFNHSNQKRGLQQRSLAHSVYVSGEHIDRLEDIQPLIMKIAHKHRALGVKPEQYPVVGETLIEAVKDVLGDGATDEIIQAWVKAYDYIANQFIGIEQKLYEQTESEEGNWEGFREFVVVKKVKESEVITSFYLKPKDNKPLASFRPGQYLTIRAKIPGEKYMHHRHYSLSDAPGKDTYRISVKREDVRDGNPPGVVSTWLHEQVQEGDVLEFSSPAGDFVLDTESTNPVVLISGGVGFTPLMSMLNTLVEKQPDRDVTCIHAAINGKHHAMKEHVARLAATCDRLKSYVIYESPTEEDRAEKSFDKEGWIDKKWLESVVDHTGADFYLCGPVPFMEVVYSALREMNVDESRIHYEAFRPLDTIDAGS